MADHFNAYPLKVFASTVADCMDFPLLTCSPDHGQRLTAGGSGSHGSKMLEDMNILHFFAVL